MLDQLLPADTVRAALQEAAQRVSSEKTLHNAERILARGNAYEMRILVDLQESGDARVIVTGRERLHGWTIYVAKNLSPDAQ
jgi:hypothetical protein